ncbi:hypothetical protein NBRC116583_30040 [Arenicella sp. 4NH20-0111]|uniref:hypothetical protein n=1 Tax=Arenicella sp. 4NH20-0111 TaxID=3127648 RepID=UPI003103A154
MTEQTTDYKPDAKTLFWNRVQLLAVFAVFLAPIAGAFLYKPTKFNNYGDLYTPAPTLAPLALTGVNGETEFAQYKEQDLWAFLVVAQGACGENCEKSILNSRQLRAMQGKHLERLRSVLIYSDLPASVAQDLAKKYQPVDVYEADPEQLKVWAEQLVPEGVPANELDDRFYVVDSKGLLMISYPSDAEPNRVKKDLSRLLKSRR